MITIDERYERAFEKARELRLHAFRNSDTEYTVRSQRWGHAWHIVKITATGIICDCEAGLAGQPCVHGAVVARRLDRERKPRQSPEPVEWATELEFDDDLYPPTQAAPATVPSARPKTRLEDLYD